MYTVYMYIKLNPILSIEITVFQTQLEILTLDLKDFIPVSNFTQAFQCFAPQTCAVIL
jgi:hypothetical protein